MAESFLYHLVNRPNSDLGDLAILDMILECVGNHDYEVISSQNQQLLVFHWKFGGGGGSSMTCQGVTRI